MTLKYESEILFDLMKRDGENAPSDVLPYESEIKEKYLNQVIGAYPKLQDYRAEWLNYNLYYNLPSDFPIESVANVTSVSFNNVVPYAYQSAILKGQTLVNLLSESNVNVKSSNTYRINYTHDLNTTKTYIFQYRINQIPELSDTTDSARLLKFEWYSGNKLGGYSDIFIKDITVGTNNFIIINPFSDEVTKTFFAIWCPNYVSGSLDMDIILIEYQDGMENWDIPYFEGMQSVKMPVLKTTGKNIFPTNNFLECGTNNQMVGQSTFEVYLKSGDYCSSCVHADESDKDTELRYKLLDEQNNQVLANGSTNRTFTIENDGLYKLQFGRGSAFNGLYTKIQVQLEVGSTPTIYEPYKTNILTVNEDVTLRSNGDICDELNLLTGQLTQRIGEDGVVLSQEVVKTVDLSCINEQSESETFRPIEGTMHVSTSSQTLPPLLDMIVPIEATSQNLMSFANILEEE